VKNILDTIAIESPFISEEIALKVEQYTKKHQCIMVSSGELMYEFTRGQLLGSWDSSISLQVERERFEDDLVQHLRTGKKSMVKRSCPPYLRVECSIHKLMGGHNCFGGPDDFQQSCKYLVSFLEQHISVKLPVVLDWIVRRVDVANCFDLGSFEAVEEYFRGLTRASYPRREGRVGRWGNHSINIPGRTTTVKAYHKGPEFYKHDYKRILRTMGKEKAEELMTYANQILRFEVELHSRKLRDDNGGQLPTVKEVCGTYLTESYDKEVSRLIRDSVREAKLCRTAEAVEKRLNQEYEGKLASVLLGMWFRLAAHGETYVKQTMTKPSFYRNRKLLVDVGVSWTATDVILKDFSLVPAGFVPVTTDSRRLTVMDKRVLEALESVA